MAGTTWIPLAGMCPVRVVGYMLHGYGTPRCELSTDAARHCVLVTVHHMAGLWDISVGEI